MPVLTTFTSLIIGFSVFSSAVLLLAYLFFLKEMHKTKMPMISLNAA